MLSSCKHNAADCLECYQLWTDWVMIQSIRNITSPRLFIFWGLQRLRRILRQSIEQLSRYFRLGRVRRTGAAGWWKISYTFCTAAVFCFVSSTFPSIVSHILEKQMPRPVKIVTIVKVPHSACFLDWWSGLFVLSEKRTFMNCPCWQLGLKRGCSRIGSSVNRLWSVVKTLNW